MSVKQHLSQKELLERATANYAASIPLALDYLESRGFTKEVARRARFGVVENPEIGHEHLVGRLAIPYITKTGVVDIRFRSMDPAVEPKYMGLVGAVTKMYNVLDVEVATNWIAVCEGELDAVTLSHCVGIPSIGIPGASGWKKHYTRVLSDFERIYIFADGDQAGKDFANALSRELPSTIVQLPDGEDVNSCFLKYGADYLLEKAGLNDEQV